MKSQEGTGLGLSISRKFVELMGGELKVESVVNEGTVFTFEILVRLIENTVIEENRQQKIVGLAANQPQYRILVVDDVEASRLLLRKMLTSLGFAVEEAGNGQEAIDVWQNWQPDLIFMDMRMPVLDGYEATKQIKSQPGGDKTVIIALTASAFEEERVVILSAGCDDFMRKPFYEAELLEKMGHHLKIDYIYEDDSHPLLDDNIFAQTTMAQNLTPEDLAVMPEDWRSQLYQAAMQVDNQEIFRLLAEIPLEYNSLTTSLKILVEQFRCDKIIDLTEIVEK